MHTFKLDLFLENLSTNLCFNHFCYSALKQKEFCLYIFFQLSLVPHGIIQVPLRFTPSQIGLGKHKAKIVFRSEQVIQRLCE